MGLSGQHVGLQHARNGGEAVHQFLQRHGQVDGFRGDGHDRRTVGGNDGIDGADIGAGVGKDAQDLGQESLLIVEQQLEGLLGSDYIDVIVEAGPSTGFLSEVRRGGKFALMKCNWGADYADPATWTEPFSDTGSDSYLHWRADTAAGVRDIIAEYDALVAEAKAQVEDMSVRYNTFAQAEASIINHAVIIPYGVEGDGFKATRLNELEAEYAPYGLARQRYKYQKLRTEPMSQNEFNTLYEAWQAERAKALAAE